jgi:hypothetical protein
MGLIEREIFPTSRGIILLIDRRWGRESGQIRAEMVNHGKDSE